MSNCNGDRLKLIEKLRERGVGVDVFGGCSGRPCPSTFRNGSAGECRAVLAAEYMFFLAFENSVCEDYITEKSFRTVQYDTIPVVHGGGKYEDYVSGGWILWGSLK